MVRYQYVKNVVSHQLANNELAGSHRTFSPQGFRLWNPTSEQYGVLAIRPVLWKVLRGQSAEPGSCCSWREALSREKHGFAFDTVRLVQHMKATPGHHFQFREPLKHKTDTEAEGDQHLTSKARPLSCHGSVRPEDGGKLS